MTVPDTISNQPCSVKEDARRALNGVRKSFGAALAELHEPVTRPNHIQQALGIDKMLAWRLSKVIYEPEIFDAVAHLPQSSAIGRFFKALEKRGVSSARIQDAQDAIDGFTEVVRIHAGDRAMFDMMLASSTDNAAHEMSRAQQRSAYQANSFLWGIQAQAQVAIAMIRPSDDDPSRVDMVSARGLLRLRRLKEDLPWTFGRFRCVSHDNDNSVSLNASPIETPPLSTTQDTNLPPVPLLEKFCTHPIPQVRRVKSRDGFIEDTLVGTPAGNTAATDIFVADIARSAAPRYTANTGRANTCVKVHTPVENLYLDLLLHNDLVPKAIPELTVYTDLRHSDDGPRTNRQQLKALGGLYHLGSAADSTFDPEWPPCASLIEHITNQLAWDLSQFQIYRVRLEHPIMPSLVEVSWPLQTSPN